MCVVGIFNFGIAVGYWFCIYLLRRIYSGFGFLLGHSHPPTYTLSPTHPHSEGVTLTRIASHWNVGRWWVVLVGQRLEILPKKWLDFGDPSKSNNIVPFDFVHNPAWALHTSAATPPPLLFTVASMTNFVGRIVLTYFIDRHKHKLLKH